MAVVTPIVPPTRRNVELALLLLAVAVAGGAYAIVGLSVQGALPQDLWLISGGLGLMVLVVHVVLRLRAPYADPVLLPVATVVNGLGLVVIHRLDLAHHFHGATSLATRQLVWSAIGVACAVAVLVAVRDHRVLARYTYLAMIAGFGVLLLPLLPVVGRQVNGARIWIGLGPLSFQPGEIAKILLALFFAGYLVTARDSLSLVGRKVLGLQLPRGRHLGPILVAWLASLGVLVFERDLGTSLLFFGLFVAVLYVATERISWIVIGLSLFAGGAVLAWTLFSHVQVRVAIWLHPFDAKNADIAFQPIQAWFGMASGGLMGSGLGQGRPDLVPFAQSDFIVAAFGEELGLTGLFALLVLYAMLVERGLRTAVGARDGFGKLLAAGLAFSIALQVFVVVGGVTRLIPLTGLTAPFMAYGGSSLVSNWVVVALLMRISDSARRPPDSVAPPVTAEVAAVVGS
jgi:cell division protein FtsW (lipid II flippase)